MANIDLLTFGNAERLHNAVDEERAVQALPVVVNLVLQLAVVGNLQVRRKDVLKLGVVEHGGGSRRQWRNRRWCRPAVAIEARDVGLEIVRTAS